MNPTIKNVLAIIAGVVVGSIVNMGILIISGNFIAPPEGVDPTDMESIKAGMENGLYEFKHYISPFLAHALGTLVGAVLAAKIAVTNKSRFALGIGVWFLVGGIANTFILPAPVWFAATDLILAYIPMGLIAGKLVK